MAMRHLEIGDQWRRQEAYRPRPMNIPPREIPRQPRQRHGCALLGQAKRIRQRFEEVSRHWADREQIKAKGLIVEFESVPGVELATEGWSDGKIPKYDLLNETVFHDASGKTIVKQRWFIRDGALEAFVRIFEEYLAKTTKKGQPKRRKLVDSIREIRLAALDALWTEMSVQPEVAEIDWYEVWLRAGVDDLERQSILYQFETEAERLRLKVGKCEERLPEHTIVHVHGSFGKLGESVALMNCIAEIRRVFRYADFYEKLTPDEQQKYVQGIRRRLKARGDKNLAVCLLDTGVESGHPLLEPLMGAGDNRSIQEAWGTADDQDHGTPMSGLAAYGNLTDVLNERGPVDVPYALEAVKIVPPKAVINTDERHAGEYTAQGVALAEGGNPERERVWCVATSLEGPNDGRPSSWSSRLDQLAAGTDNEGEVRRLFCVSAGNVPIKRWNDYPGANREAPIENPGQAWNSICVGSFTELARVSEQTERQGYQPIAGNGAMAPSNRTSAGWDSEWPAKPDIVMEGGNAGKREQRDLPYKAPELQLLSTEAEFRTTPFCLFDGTSSATALAARMAATIKAEYPGYWPETIRGLMIHSADWTLAMEAAAPSADERGTPLTDKQRREFLLRTVGYGTPQLARALHDLPNCVTMVAQAELQPFKNEKPKPKYNQYDIYTFPWPKTGLEQFWENDVRMRVTLSYFVEPNPGNRISTRYRYPGCRLKFKVSAPNQRLEDLRTDVNYFAAREEEGEWIRGESKGWRFGPHTIFKGSVHTDIWEGTAADLLSMKHIVVFPTAGWWKSRLRLGRADSSIKYSLIVSLEAPTLDVDLYAEIANQIAVPIAIPASR